MATRMNETEFDENLKKFGMQRRDACSHLFNKTGTVISASHIQTQFNRSGRLSASATAMWRLFFQQLESEGAPKYEH